MAINPNTDFTSGAVLTAAQQNRFPRGVMGAVYRTAGDVAMTTAVADVTGMSITFTAVANRTYKASWTASGYKSTTNGWAAMYLTNSSNTIFGSVYNTALISGVGYFNLSGFTYLNNLTAGSQTLKLRQQVENLNGLINASGTNPCVFMIEDCGPS
jgi:hypothetical protein